MNIFTSIFCKFDSFFFLKNIFHFSISLDQGFSTIPNLLNYLKYLKSYSGLNNKCNE